LSGADVTPWIFYENFIAVMVNIDSNDGYLTLLETRAGTAAGCGFRTT
jgi:hypothetical protein